MQYYTDSIHKIAYATDASVYREIPYGVAYPETEDDTRELMRIAKEKGVDLIPRAGGTLLAGQVVGSGIVVDISKHWNKILEINAEERWARVQPGVVRDELNIALKPYGLFFSPETSTSNRCCIGGMFGNNSCGTHSLVYGSTRHHVIACKAILSDGSVEEFKNYSIEELKSRFGDEFWVREHHESLIEQKYDLPYFNYLKDKRFTEEDFFNGSHLSDVGEKKFIIILNKDIVSLEKGHGGLDERIGDAEHEECDKISYCPTVTKGI